MSTLPVVSSSFPTIALIAGEVSGDMLGASLIQQLKIIYPQARFVGIGGDRMKAQGFESWFDMEKIAVMGLAEVVKHLPTLLGIRKAVTKQLLETKPDIFIGIDAPDFNLHVETQLKTQGVKTVHYVSPSVWAWRQNRIHTIAQATHLVLAFLPFEKAFYDKFNVPCRFVGHSMAEQIALKPDRTLACRALNLEPKENYLALLCGSRQAEVNFLAEPFLKTAKILKEKFPSLKFLVPFTNEKRKAQFEAIKASVAPDLEMIYLQGNAREALTISKAALLASGTASLEAMLCKCPMVVGYKMKGLTYQLAKKLVKTPYISLPNLLANEMLIAERIQEGCTPEQLAEDLMPLLSDELIYREQRFQLIQRFTDLHRLIQCDADKEAALAIQALLEGKKND